MTAFNVNKEQLLPALAIVAGAVDRKQAFPILANFLITLKNHFMTITATDLEIEVSAELPITYEDEPLSFTVPAKKMMDIIRALEDKLEPSFSLQQDLFIIKEKRSQFKLATMPAEDFPASKQDASVIELSLPRLAFLHLLQSTHFAISQQEVRAYLNGLLLEFNPKSITAVATDGHRLALNQIEIVQEPAFHRILLPRKGVQEVLKLLAHCEDETIQLFAGLDHFKLVTKQFVLFSSLIESRFPPYAKAIPKDHDKTVVVDTDALKRSLSRIVILANEKSRAIIMQIEPNLLTIIANNQEKEEAFDAIEAETTGGAVKIGLNANYLIDVLSYISDSKVKISLGTEDDSILIESMSDAAYRYIIMPMKI